MKEGWPSCGYTVSKMGINAFTRLVVEFRNPNHPSSPYFRILQKQLDDEGREDVVVNAAYPCTKHSKIDQSEMQLYDDEEGARFVYYMATVMKNSHGVFPRGQVIWNNARVEGKKDHYNWNNKHKGQAY